MPTLDLPRREIMDLMRNRGRDRYESDGSSTELKIDHHDGGLESLDEWPDHGPVFTCEQEERRHKLIDKSFLHGLSAAEEYELNRLQYLADFDPSHVEFFRPIFERLGMELPRFRMVNGWPPGTNLCPVSAEPCGVGADGVTWWRVTFGVKEGEV